MRTGYISKLRLHTDILWNRPDDEICFVRASRGSRLETTKHSPDRLRMRLWHTLLPCLYRSSNFSTRPVLIISVICTSGDHVMSSVFSMFFFFVAVFFFFLGGADATMKKLPQTTRSQLETAICSKVTEMRLRWKNSWNFFSCNFQLKKMQLFIDFQILLLFVNSSRYAHFHMWKWTHTTHMWK